ncbi:hypothetical protein D7V94_06120 [Parablautia intestinalis]|uniref:tRNA(Met) cytidine acetate ligase n=1 Tax=Parablautia intestinalis TaxID=2320100 RepID=A0A3A9AMT3_9FIRM|nr:nucleotidyltransferase family protein [Parablautia intestinalis]RKI92880.1 hypothetical protein D7V94_06120 [Parablautia intestinalis]
MRTTAIIAEYNPFHNGHQFQIEQTRRQTEADFILIVMSGDFVQRGAPAFCDKYTRTKMALSCGADVVIELPSLYALSSAEFFAGGAIDLLKQLQVIQTLSFGSESGDLSLFTDCAPFLLQNNALVHARLKDRLKSGCPYPAAMEYTVTEILSERGLLSFDLSDTRIGPLSSLSSAKIHELFSSPNNILALEYCKALYAAYGCAYENARNQRPESIRQDSENIIYPFTLKRQGNGYHSLSFEDGTAFISASAARSILDSAALQKYIPGTVYDLLVQNNLLTPPVTENHFSTLLHYKLLSEQERGFAGYLDCDPDLSDKICKCIPDFSSFTGFCGLLKSKDITYARVSRVLMHILLNIKTPDFFKAPLHQRKLFVPYARLLGFRQGAAPLLHAIKKSSAIPLLSKPADARFLLSKEAYSLLKQDFFCSSVYESVAAPYRDRPFINERKQSPIVMP